MTDPTLEPAAPAAATLGQTLRAAREARQISLEDVNRHLKYSVRQLAALEADDYSGFPSRVLLQGVVRNYGKMLGVDPAQLASLLSTVLPETPPQPIVPTYEATSFQDSPRSSGIRVMPFLVGGVAAILVGGALYFGSKADWKLDLFSHKGDKPASQATTSTEAQPDGAVPINLPPDAEADRAASEAPGADTVKEAGASAAAPVGEGELELSTTEAAWVEVRDGQGKKLLSQMLQPGQPLRTQGTPPYRVKVGNAPRVTVTFRGQAVDLAPFLKGSVARLELK